MFEKRELRRAQTKLLEEQARQIQIDRAKAWTADTTAYWQKQIQEKIDKDKAE